MELEGIEVGALKWKLILNVRCATKDRGQLQEMNEQLYDISDRKSVALARCHVAISNFVSGGQKEDKIMLSFIDHPGSVMCI